MNKTTKAVLKFEIEEASRYRAKLVKEILNLDTNLIGLKIQLEKIEELEKRDTQAEYDFQRYK